MTTSIPTNTNAPASDKSVVARPVTLIIAEAANGRIPVTITVVPIADLDAKGGVFVDLRMDAKEAAAEVVSADETPHVGRIAKGDAAVAGMVKKEAAAEKALAGKGGPAPEAKDATAKEPAAKEPGKKKAPPEKSTIVSHQIAQGLDLTVGQAQTFRAEVAVPAPGPDGETWHMRARFSSITGRDLKSAWQRI